MDIRVPYVDIGGQYIEHKSKILSIIDEVMQSGAYILGEHVERFEIRFAKYCGTQFAVSVANGTDALIIALRAFEIGPGDEVITVPNSWVSSASAIALIGATPVFVDVREDQNIDTTKIESVITKKTKAIIPVHLTGKPAKMDEIIKIAQKYNLRVIEDAAQAIGARFHKKKTGSLGDIGCFSLHPLKNLNAFGDAGIMTTNDPKLANNLRLLRNHGLKNRNEITRWGYNSRLDAVQAAVLDYKLSFVDDVIKKRRNNSALYRTLLNGIEQIHYLPQDAIDSFDVYHLFVIQCDHRDELQFFLKSQGISTAIHYPIPIHMQECASYMGYKSGSFPVVEQQSTHILSLPIYQTLKTEQIRHVADSIRQYYSKKMYS